MLSDPHASSLLSPKAKPRKSHHAHAVLLRGGRGQTVLSDPRQPLQPPLSTLAKANLIGWRGGLRPQENRNDHLRGLRSAAGSSLPHQPLRTRSRLDLDRVLFRSAFNPFFTLVPFNGTSYFVWARTDGPCDPRAPVQSVQGRGMGVPSWASGLTWAVSTICARAGRCHEGGLSSS